MEQPWKRQVYRFCHQYLQLEQNLDFPEDRYLRLPEVQDAIFSVLFADESLSHDSRHIRYQARKLKELIARIEAGIDDWDEHAVSDDLMSYLSSLLSSPSPNEADTMQQRYHVVYHIASLPHHEARIRLLENRSLISAGGTTGFRTWEAALHLGQFLCRNPSIVSGKRILELGSGTGYLSILCVKYLRSSHVMASDGSDDVVNNLPENISLNQLQDSHSIAVRGLEWGRALMQAGEQHWNCDRPIDVVLGADIT